MNTPTISSQAWMLRLEGLGVLLLAATLYGTHSGDWVMFMILALAPDLALIGLAFGKRAGAMVYNLTHTYALPLVLILIGLLSEIPMLISVMLIWFAHIGADRLLGYGLKYTVEAKDTHLQRV